MIIVKSSSEDKMVLFKHQGSKNWYYSFTHIGKVYFRSTKTANKTLGERIAHNHREQVLKESVFGRELKTITLGEAMAAMAESRKKEDQYSNLLSLIKAMGGDHIHHKTKKKVKTTALDVKKQLHAIDDVDLHQFVMGKLKDGRSEWTVVSYMTVFRNTVKWAKSNGYRTNPTLVYPSIKPPKKRPVFLTAAEEKALLESLDPFQFRPGYGHPESRAPFRHQRLVDQQDFVTALLDCGGRYSELSNLSWEHVDFTKNTVYLIQTKTNTALTHVMTDRMRQMMLRRSASKTHEHWVFANDDRDGPRKYSSEWFQRSLRRAGIKKRFNLHKCRSTFASKLVQNGASLFEVQTLLGHTSPASTLVYAELVPTAVSEKAAGILNRLSI